MTVHPPLTDLVDRSEDPEIAAHLSDCPSCRARWRLLTTDPPGELPGLDEARSAMTRARQTISQQMSFSLGADPFDEPEELEIGRSVERYRVEERVGRGGMGTVYRVRHVQLDSLHALKLLHRTSRSVRERLVREGRAQSQLRHPNVVPVTDIVDVDGAPGLVMEFIDGPTLAKYVAAEGPIPLVEADRLAVEIIRGVAAAHAAGIVHRDLKPANVLLQPTADGLVAKVTDFGLARQLAQPDDAGLTAPNGPLGTPAYMAPEQIYDASRADARSDVFSLGAVLYELVTGRQAFEGPDVVSIYDRVRAGDYTPPERVVPELPPRMATTIARALALDPAERFADCRQLLAAWRAGVDAPSIGDPATTMSRTIRPSPSWSRWLLPAAGATALTAAVGVVSFVMLWPAPPAPEPAAVTSSQPKQDGLRERRLTAQSDDLQIYAVATSPDGESFVYTDGRGIWSQEIDGGTARLVLPGGAYHNLGYFPDGARIFTSGWDDGREGTWTLRLDGSELTKHQDGTGHIARLSPDGERIAFSTSTGVWVSAIDGTERTRVRSLSTSDTTAGLVWSPSGQSVAAVHVPATGEPPWLEVTRVDGSSTRRLVEHSGLASLSIAALAWVNPDTLIFVTSEMVEDELVSTVSAIDDAETAIDGSGARPVHSWTDFFVLRLEPSADARRFVTSRASATLQTALLDLDNPGALRPPTDEDWSETPMGWLASGELLVRSERGGGGLYAYDLGGGAPRLLLKDATGLARVDVFDDALGLVRVDKKADPPRLVAETAPLSGGESTPLFELRSDAGARKSHGGRYTVCRPDRCLMSKATDDGVAFSWIDRTTGERGPTVFDVPLTAKWMRWDLSPDGLELAVATADPPRLRIRDLESGETRDWAAEIDFPQGVAWAPSGDAVFVSGLVDASQHPYRLVSVSRDGAVETLWTAMSQNVADIRPSPDGRTLALGLQAFDDDLWLVEGLLGEGPADR